MTIRFSLVCCLLFICSCKKPAPPPPAPAPAAATAETAGAGPGDEEVRPVYSDVAGATDPLAEKLCTALHVLPEARRAACCKITPGIDMSSECVKIVSAATHSKAVTLDAGKVSACAAAMDKALSGCLWPGPWGVGVPVECERLLVGHRPQGELCRSSLECQTGLRCRGVGPTATGRCDKPLPTGERCALAVDALAVYAREEVDVDHPECTGFCGHRACFDKVSEGGKCVSVEDCKSGLHCSGTVCKKGLLSAAGEACVGEACADGTRCMNGVCGVPRDDGSCSNDRECRGGCLKKDPAAVGVCGMRCDQR